MPDKIVRFYFGGIYQHEYVLKTKYKLVSGINRLLSFSTFGKASPMTVKKLREWVFVGNDRAVIFDSGAFTVWNSGGVIDPDKYLEFIRQVQETFPEYELTFIALDMISKDKVESARETCKNFLYAKKQGIMTLPTYHAGEDLDILSVYANESDYICFGGLYGNLPKSSVKDENVEGLFGYTDENTVDKAFNRLAQLNWKGKVHGLAVGYPKALMKYDFYSVDTTTCMILGTRGRIFLDFESELVHASQGGLTDDVRNRIKNDCELLNFEVDWLAACPYCRIMFNVYRYTQACIDSGVNIDYGKFFTRKIDATMPM